MFITQSLIEKVGRRSPMIRSAMVQAGDKIRLDALKEALLSIGVCELTRNDVEQNAYAVQEKKFAFNATPLTYVLLDGDEFNRFPRIASSIDLEVAHALNGVVGIKNEQTGE